MKDSEVGAPRIQGGAENKDTRFLEVMFAYSKMLNSHFCGRAWQTFFPFP